MKRTKLFTAVIAVSLILFTGCKKEIKTDSTSATADLQIENQSLSKQSTGAAGLKSKYQKLMASLPAGFKEKLKQSAAISLKAHPEYRDLILRTLRVTEPASCNANTPVHLWLDKQLADWNSEVIGYVLDLGMLDLPTYDAIVFENSSANQYFGVNGEYTQRLTKTFKDLKRFWNIQSNDMVLAAMHGSMLGDRDKVIRTYVAVFNIDRATAAKLADFIVALIDVIPQYRDGNHPFFTFNSYALEGFAFPPYGVIPDKIIMGDGIMDAYAAVGYKDVAPQAILAHEFGHHIQFQLGLFGNENTPEATRRTELMADAYSAYYLSHARGASMQWKRVKQFLQVFFNIGDCSFTSTNHHGTPTQRIAAAEWAYNLANNAQKQGHILTSQKFTALFEAQLPKILKQ